MSDVYSLVHNMEELLAVCSRSIVAPDMIIIETNRLLALMNDRNVDRKFVVDGCERLSFLASGFLRSGYDSFIISYAHKTGINHWTSGFSNKDELISFCEFCVKYGDESLGRIKNDILMQLEVENRMTKDEICNRNIKKFELKQEIMRGISNFEIRKAFCDSYQNLITVQDQITNYIKLSLLVNSLKEFFKEYYKGLN
jgi:hypothetical protein